MGRAAGAAHRTPAPRNAVRRQRNLARDPCEGRCVAAAGVPLRGGSGGRLPPPRMGAAHAAAARRHGSGDAPYPRPLAGHPRRQTVPHVGLLAGYLLPRGGTPPRGRNTEGTARQHPAPHGPGAAAPRRGAGHRRQRPRTGRLETGAAAGRHPLSRVVARADRHAPLRVQVPDRRPPDPHPDHLGRGPQPHLVRSAGRRRGRRRRHDRPADSRTPLARRRHGHSGLLAPLGQGLRHRRVPRPQAAGRLGRGHGAAYPAAAADQRHDDDRYVGGLLSLQRQLDLRAASAVPASDGGGRRGERRIPPPARRAERPARGGLRTGQPHEGRPAAQGLRAPRRPHGRTPRLQGVHGGQPRVAAALRRLPHAARRLRHGRLLALGRLRPLRPQEDRGLLPRAAQRRGLPLLRAVPPAPPALRGVPLRPQPRHRAEGRPADRHQPHERRRLAVAAPVPPSIRRPERRPTPSRPRDRTGDFRPTTGSAWPRTTTPGGAPV